MSTFMDYTGERFGKLVVTEYVGRNNDNRPLWRCKCDCGNEITITSRNISKRNVTSCGCDKREDLTGKKFGRWTVIGKAQKIGRYYYWHCRCDCGNEKDVRERSLKEGTSQSCGCIQKEVASKICSETKRGNLIGMKFGRLTVISRLGYDMACRGTMWHCKCDCGNEIDVVCHALTQGKKTSCGCYFRGTELIPQKTQGESNTRLYNIYWGMIGRCYSPSVGKAYKNYGGRGIKVCEEWRKSFYAFKEWALSHEYTDELTLDRIDVNGDYCPENCRWATRTQQANNTRKNIKLTYQGETHTATDWERIKGIKAHILRNRKKHGWSDKDCFEVPIKKI